MDVWFWFWLGILALSLVIEIASSAFLTIWFGIGALVAFGVERLNAPVWLQWILFLTISILSLIFFRKMALEKLKTSGAKTNVDEVIGDIGIVTEDIVYIEGSGSVKIKGKIWSARAEKEQLIPKDSKVRILRVEGVKVFVEKVQEEKGEN